MQRGLLALGVSAMLLSACIRDDKVAAFTTEDVVINVLDNDDFSELLSAEIVQADELVGVTLSSNGTLTIPAGNTVGHYRLIYKACGAIGRHQFCDTAAVNIALKARTIVIANDDNVVVDPSEGGTFSLLANDTINGNAPEPNTVSVSLLSNGGLSTASFDAQGNLVVSSGSEEGNYTLEYEICEKANLSNCDIATIQLTVDAPEPNVFFQFELDEGDDLPSQGSLTVLINGQTITGVDASARLSLSLAPGEYDLQVMSTARAAARLRFTVEEEGRVDEIVSLKSEALGLIGDYDVKILGAGEDGVVNPAEGIEIGIFDSEGNQLPFDTLTMAFATRIEIGSFVDNFGGIDVSNGVIVTDQFVLNGASISVNDINLFSTTLEELGVGEFEIEIAIYDSVNDRIYEDVVFFRLGDRVVEGELSGPFDTSSREINLQSVDGMINRTSITDSNGAFSFTALPPAVYQISAIIDDGNGEIRSAAGLVRTLIAGDTATLTPITLAERDAGASEFAVENQFTQGSIDFKTSFGETEQRRIHLSNSFKKEKQSISPEVSSEEKTEEMTSVTAGSQGQAERNSVTLEIPASSNSVTVMFSVTTEEYPKYVLDQSEFDDQWSLRVFDERGVPTFSSFSNVNAQLSSAPFPELVWRGSGSTGTVQETIELTPIEDAAEGDTRSIRLEVQATNIGDNILPTTVEGTLSAEESGVSLEWVDAFRTNAPGGVDGTVISIPDSGSNNTFDVRLSWAATNSETGEPIDRDDFGEITAELQLGAGGATQEIFTQDGVSGPVTAGGQDGTFRTNIAFISPNPSSSISTSNPSEQRVQYEVELTADVDGTSSSDSATSGSKIALYAGVLSGGSRSGNPDTGGDDWATEQTYSWMQSNRSLLSDFVGDISGEHGRNIGHSTHKDGKDIDFRQWGTTYSGTGGNIFNAARNDAITIISGGDNVAAATTRLTAFVTGQRTNITALAANSGVGFIYGPHGAAGNSLPNGWLNSLIRNGSFTATGASNTVVNVGGSLSASSKYVNRTQNDHNDHYHVHIN